MCTLPPTRHARAAKGSFSSSRRREGQESTQRSSSKRRIQALMKSDRSPGSTALSSPCVAISRDESSVFDAHRQAPVGVRPAWIASLKGQPSGEFRPTSARDPEAMRKSRLPGTGRRLESIGARKDCKCRNEQSMRAIQRSPAPRSCRRLPTLELDVGVFDLLILFERVERLVAPDA